MDYTKVKVEMFEHDGSPIGEYEALKYDWFYDVSMGEEHYSFAVSNGAQIGVLEKGRMIKEGTR